MYANESRGYFGGRGRGCRRLETEGQEPRGMGFNGIPWGGGRGRCFGGGNEVWPGAQIPGRGDAWSQVETLRKKVDELEKQLEAMRNASPREE
jgi:hypothetical protein